MFVAFKCCVKVLNKKRRCVLEIPIYANFSNISAPKPVGRRDLSRFERVKSQTKSCNKTRRHNILMACNQCLCYIWLAALQNKNLKITSIAHTLWSSLKNFTLYLYMQDPTLIETIKNSSTYSRKCNLPALEFLGNEIIV